MVEQSSQPQVEKLRKVPLFTELSDEALGHVVNHATEFEVEAGHVLVQPHMPGAGLFVIEEGSVSVELPGRKVNLGPGEFFGELALLHERATHNARVCADTHLRCIAIARDDFDELLEMQPRLAVTMLKTIAQRLATGPH